MQLNTVLSWHSKQKFLGVLGFSKEGVSFHQILLILSSLYLFVLLPRLISRVRLSLTGMYCKIFPTLHGPFTVCKVWGGYEVYSCQRLATSAVLKTNPSVCFILPYGSMKKKSETKVQLLQHVNLGLD